MNRESKRKRMEWAEHYHSVRVDLLRGLLEKVGSPLTGAQVGVWDGDFDLRLLAGCPAIDKLYGVDPYTIYTVKGKVVRGWDQSKWDRLFDLTCKKLAPFGERFEMVRMPSTMGLPTLPPLDFVIIDGDSSFLGVTNNIVVAEERTFRGGLICGDLYWAKPQFVDGVREAVDLCAQKFGRKLQTDKESWMWWWFIE